MINIKFEVWDETKYQAKRKMLYDPERENERLRAYISYVDGELAYGRVVLQYEPWLNMMKQATNIVEIDYFD